jgi:hypothetical protein
MAKLGRETILAAVHDLPPEEQIEIARAILAAMDAAQAARLAQVARELAELHSWLEARSGAVRGKAKAASLRGIARMGVPPDDETVERWLDEHRTEKYGG